MIEILWAKVSDLDESGLSYALSDYRWEKLRAQKLPEARRAGIGAELLLLKALRRRCPDLALPPTIVREPDGRPVLSGCEKHFSLSHSGVYAACALSDAPVGLDIQTPRSVDESFSARFLASEERSYIEQSADKSVAFAEIWTRKESLLKASGEGLRRELRSFSTVPDALRLPEDLKNCVFRTERFPEFFLSVCSFALGEAIHIEKTELP